MWVMLNDAFLSIVAHETRPKMLWVRARQREDIEAVFPEAHIRATPQRDYQFRTLVKRTSVERAMAAEVRRIDYTNFKNSVGEPARHDAYLDVWTRMFRWGSRNDDDWQQYRMGGERVSHLGKAPIPTEGDNA